MFIDTHTHFNIVMKRLKTDEKTLLHNLKSNNIIHAVQVAISIETSHWSFDFAQRNGDEGALYTLGIQPSSLAGRKELDALDTLVARAVKELPGLLFGIGECGLDYYRMHQDKYMQITGFVHQITLSKQYDLPLIIHIRDAMTDAIEILTSQSPVWGIMHCFSGDRDAAQKALDLGFYISFAGNLTYKNAHVLHDSAKYVPIDRLLLETDAPFLAPVPYRGKVNRSEYVMHTYEYMAKIKNISLSVLKEKYMKTLIQ